LRGTNIVLSAHFLDAAGEYADPEVLKISVYPVGKDPEDPDVTVADAWVYNVTTTSGGEGPLADPTRLLVKNATGKYSYTFPIPADAELGAAFDRWEATLDSESLDSTFSFTIVGGGSVGTTQLYNNNILFLTLSDSIMATDGSTLGTETTYYFTTTYTPLYSSIRRVRLDMGQFLANVPDDTINFAIFEASLKADLNKYSTAITNTQVYNASIREYTTCLAEWTLARALLGDSGISERMSKTLGDLSVSRGGNLNALKDAIAKFEDCAVRWEITLQTGGDVGPGMSLRPQVSIKGAWAEDAIVVNRQWEPTSGIGVNTSSAGNDYTYASGRRDLKTFRSRG